MLQPSAENSYIPLSLTVRGDSCVEDKENKTHPQASEMKSSSDEAGARIKFDANLALAANGKGLHIAL
jgi:hypothetical protein